MRMRMMKKKKKKKMMMMRGAKEVLRHEKRGAADVEGFDACVQALQAGRQTGRQTVLYCTSRRTVCMYAQRKTSGKPASGC
ncbi:hypothetical protein BKA81DRAFT_344022 [Phyllosticta paracitricarpa]